MNNNLDDIMQSFINNFKWPGLVHITLEAHQSAGVDHAALVLKTAMGVAIMGMAQAIRDKVGEGEA